MSFDNIFGISADALNLREKRLSVLSQNIANGDTPNYKARDFDFNKALQQAISRQSFADNDLKSNSAKHINNIDSENTFGLGDALKYRIPNSSSLDGNTVDIKSEQIIFAEETVRYRASLEFVNSKIRKLKLAFSEVR